jgi:hypothetical protein
MTATTMKLIHPHRVTDGGGRATRRLIGMLRVALNMTAEERADLYISRMPISVISR